MLKRANKIAALLVAATSMLSLVPAIAADSTTSRLESKDGHITNAIAYKDGKYIYQGYKSDDDTDSIYYNGGDKDKELDDLDDADLNTTYEDRYAFANDGSDQYLVDLSSGSVSDDETPVDDADSAATKLQTKLKKADRYGSNVWAGGSSYYGSSMTAENTFNAGASIDDNQVVTIPGNKFGDSWYAYDVKTSASDAQNYLVGKDANYIGHLYGFTNTSGKYIDASYTANIYAYSTKEGKTVKIENYSNNYDDVDSDSGLLATLVGQPVALTQDNDYIYALTTVAITDTATNAVITGGTTTTAASYVTGITGSAKTTIRTYVQKIAKAQGEQKDDAYLPKTVESYEVGNADGDEYNCGDAKDAYAAILAAIKDTDNGSSITSLADVTQSMVTGTDSDNGLNKAIFTISGGKLVAIKSEAGESVDAVTLNLKKDKLKFNDTMPGYKTVSATTSTASKVAFNSDTKVDAYFVEKDSDDSVDIDDDAKAYEAYDIDVNGNIWVVAEGKIYEYKAGGDMTKVYTCDSSLDSISVYDENSLITWEDDGDIYTNISEGKTSTETPTTTANKTGWDQSSDGSWNYYNDAGTKVVNNWVNSGDNWYYMDANGTMMTGWKYDGGNWYYLNPISDGTKGSMKTGWQYVDGNWYYLNPNSDGTKGAMKTGWQYVNGYWYYLNPVSGGPLGAMLANTTINGYVLGSDGAML